MSYQDDIFLLKSGPIKACKADRADQQGVLWTHTCSSSGAEKHLKQTTPKEGILLLIIRFKMGHL